MNTITVDLLADLKDQSHLKALLEKSQSAAFSIASDLARFADQPVQAAVGAPPAALKISRKSTWKTSSGIGFSLTPEASCSISVSASSSEFPIAKSAASAEKQKVCAGPAPGVVYINIDLDFSINGAVSGSGTAAGIGISGKASGSSTATLTYCHAVDAATPTFDALKQAFSSIAFPFQPDCALTMHPGDLARVSFDATLGLSLQATYGLASFKFSAPGADAVQKSVAKGFETLSLPTVEIEAGAKASISYTHTDRFAAIVHKTADKAALLYLIRSSARDTAFSAGVSAGIKVTEITVTVDQKALASAVGSVSGPATLAGEKAVALTDKLQASLFTRTNKFITELSTDAGILVQASKTDHHTLQYVFQADLTDATLATRSWESFARADLSEALQIGGLTLLPGSGVASELKKTVSVGLHFFNLFSAETTSIYFQKASSELGPDGHIRFLYDIGHETDSKTKNTLHTSRIHFVASATAADKDRIKDLAIDLAIELSESGDAADRTRIASILANLPPSGDVLPAIATHATAPFTLALVLKSSAYQRLSCSAYTGKKNNTAPALPQREDSANWTAYATAVQSLMDLPFAASFTYAHWQEFNRFANNGDDTGLPSRRDFGNVSAVPSTFYSACGVSTAIAPLAAFYLQSTAHFMNLCDGLDALADSLPGIDTHQAWDALLTTLTALSKQLSSDWSRPAAHAILHLCAPGAQFDTAVHPTKDKLVCTVTVV